MINMTMKKSQRITTQALKKITLASYFALLLFMPLWLLVLNPSSMSPLLSLALFTVPLLFPLKGLLQGNPYTYAWTNFIVMIYFLHSLTTLWVIPEDRVWASLELLFTTLLFFAGSYYAKYRGQELGLSLRKNNATIN